MSRLMEGRNDRQALFYRTLLATTGCPTNIQIKIHFFDINFLKLFQKFVLIISEEVSKDLNVSFFYLK